MNVIILNQRESKPTSGARRTSRSKLDPRSDLQEELQEPRRPYLRDRNIIQRPDNYISACVSIIDEEHQTYIEAVNSKHPQEWMQALEENINSLKKNKTWFLKKLLRKPISCKWVYKIKRYSDGFIDRYKACVVARLARGFFQKGGIDYTETFAPVVRYGSIRLLLALAIENDIEIMQFDIKTAFLYGDLAEEVYMMQTEEETCRFSVQIK